MGLYDVGRVTLTDIKNVPDIDYKVAPITPDAAGDLEETEWQNSKANQYLGYYKKIPEVHNTINALSIYAVGQGWDADAETTIILENITGWGEDTINSIFDNLIRCKKIYGDAFAEIMRDEKTGILINLKVLDPGSLKIIVNRQGKIKRYEQWAKTGKTNRLVHKFMPNELLHVSNNRTADEIHGISIIEPVEWIILAKNEAMDDRKTVLHRNVNPMRIIYVDTESQGKIDELKTKYENQIKNKEVMIVPMDTMRVEVPQIQVIDSESWIKYLDNAFYEVLGIPKIVTGGSQEFTEASSKIAYTTFEQIYKREQREFEADLWNQLQVRLTFHQPVSLKNELITSEAKNESQLGFQPNDMIAGRGQ